MAWAKVVSQAVGNPLYHWSHMELRTYFAIDLPLNELNAPIIWEKTLELLKQPEYHSQALIIRSNVVALNTTDDPVDSLEYHEAIKHLPDFKVKVWPTFRPDKALFIGKPTFLPWLKSLENLCGSVETISDLQQALVERLDFFHEQGCRISDHGLEAFVYDAQVQEQQVQAILEKVRLFQPISWAEADAYQSYMLFFLGKEYAKRGWVMQLHLGVARNINTQRYETLGPDTGFDAIGCSVDGVALAGFFNALQKTNHLPKTILYSIHPTDTLSLTTLMGAFQQDIRGKMQLGSGWWFNDTKKGMIKQMTDLACAGMLATFVGMLTDSRSFISYPRHDYFRRILCNILGQWIENGEIIYDEPLLKDLIEDIAFNNIWRYTGS